MVGDKKARRVWQTLFGMLTAVTGLVVAQTQGGLRGKRRRVLDLMRNTIHARHGRRFNRADLQRHFDAQPGCCAQPCSSRYRANVDYLIAYPCGAAS